MLHLHITPAPQPPLPEVVTTEELILLQQEWRSENQRAELLGVKTLTLEDNASNIYLQTNLTPGAQPPGFQMNNDGTQITISANHLISNSNGWHDSNGVQNRRVKLTAAADQNATTQTIITSPDLNVFGTISSLTGSGFVSATDFEPTGH